MNFDSELRNVLPLSTAFLIAGLVVAFPVPAWFTTDPPGSGRKGRKEMRNRPFLQVETRPYHSELAVIPAYTGAGGEEGSTTVEYAIGAVATAAFAGLLLAVLKSGGVKGMIQALIESALSL